MPISFIYLFILIYLHNNLPSFALKHQNNYEVFSFIRIIIVAI